MANVLENPNAWQDYSGASPPSYFNGLGYLMQASGGGSLLRMTLMAANPGDTLVGTVAGSGFSSAAYLNLVEVGSVVHSFPMDGVERALDLPAVVTARFVVAATPSGTEPTTVYNGAAGIEIPVPEVQAPPLRILNYLRAFWGVDTPQSVWVRSDEGPLDLSSDDITVQIRWPWLAWAQLPALGDSDGQVAFTVPASLILSYWGDDYGIRRSTFNGQQSLVRIVSAQRGILAMAYLEVV